MTFSIKFLSDQLWQHEPCENIVMDRVNARRVKARRSVWLLAATSAGVAVAYPLHGWTITFTVTAAAMGGSVVCFWCATRSPRPLHRPPRRPPPPPQPPLPPPPPPPPPPPCICPPAPPICICPSINPICPTTNLICPWICPPTNPICPPTNPICPWTCPITYPISLITYPISPTTNAISPPHVARSDIRESHLECPSASDQLHQNDGSQVCLSPPVELLRYERQRRIKFASGCHRASFPRINSTAHLESDSTSTSVSPISQPCSIAHNSALSTCPLPSLLPKPPIQLLRCLASILIMVAQNCTAMDVKKCKLLLKMVLLCSTFLVFSLTTQTGDAFFPGQGVNLMSSNLPFWFVVVRKELNRKMIKWLLPKSNQRMELLKILVGMTLSPLCFFIACLVEARRLRITRDNNCLCQPEKTIPMSVFWLAPQFFILGLMDVLAKDGLKKFFSRQFPEWKFCISVLRAHKFMEGIGGFLGMFVLHVSKSFFGETLNLSRLDKYYLRISILGLVNMMVYCSVYSPLILKIAYRNCSDAVRKELREKEEDTDY